MSGWLSRRAFDIRPLAFDIRPLRVSSGGEGAYSSICSLNSQPLQEHDRLCVNDLAAAHHCERLVHFELDNLDVLALVDDPTALIAALVAGVARVVEVQSLGHRAWAHIGSEESPYLADFNTCLLPDLPPDRGLRIIVVQQPGARLDEHPIGVIVRVSGPAELPRQQDSRAIWIVEQDDRAVATVVRLALL